MPAAFARVLVTGAAGRLGRVVVRELARRGIAATGLVLPGSDPVPELDRVVAGDARDPAVVATALSEVDAVIHLAAIPSPDNDPAEVVFATNTLATFTVLDGAARAGVRAAAIASSYSVTGLPFAPTLLAPAYLPIDEELPLQVTDAYALSKQVDEATAAMIWRRYRLPVVALRFPFLGDVASNLPARVAKVAADPATGIRELWGYLDLRDAARACVDALAVPEPGCHVIGLAAPRTLSAIPTTELLDRYLPEVPRRAEFPGWTVPIDLTRAAKLLGFTAAHPWPIEEQTA
jgi:nucleoside-diphosphate-sugar epimerase